jgi:hypothetical protein
MPAALVVHLIADHLIQVQTISSPFRKESA